MKKIEMLQILSDKVSNCKICKDLQSRTQTVFGVGNVDAKLMFIGEGPGSSEDEQGRPFVGPAGQLLDSIIKAIGLTREEVYITNIVKCRPPRNRTPTPQETKNCEGFLKLQIKTINPKFIICLGSTAAKSLLKIDQPISYIRGTWFQYEDAHVKANVMPIYHPAYLLRNLEAKKEVAEDMQIFLEKFNAEIC